MTILPQSAAGIGEVDDRVCDGVDDTIPKVMIGDDEDEHNMSVERDSSPVVSSGSYSDNLAAWFAFLDSELESQLGKKMEPTPVRIIYRNDVDTMLRREDEISSLRESHMRTLHCQGKLSLVLELEGTLLNTISLMDLTEEEGYLKSRAHSPRDVSGGDLFILESMGLMTKLRPFVRTFLKEASQMFELYIYTDLDWQYATMMAELLDPEKEYFGDRIISWEYQTMRRQNQKTLDRVQVHESSVLIIDDAENAWPDHKDHLIVIQRYHFFASSCEYFGVKSQSLSQLKKDESESCGSLASILRVLKETHRLFFEGGVEDLSGRDVSSILRQVI